MKNFNLKLKHLILLVLCAITFNVYAQTENGHEYIDLDNTVLEFDGTRYMTIPDHDDFDIASNESFTVSAKFRYNALTENSNQRIIAKRNFGVLTQPGYELWGGNSTTQILAVNSPNASNNYDNSLSVWSTKTGVAGEWYHVALVIDRTNNVMTLYHNGEAVGSSSGKDISQWSCETDYDVYVGALLNGSNVDYKMNGAVDDLRFYGRALSASDVATDMNSSKPLENALAAYDFEMMSGYSVPDITGNGHTGTLVGFPEQILERTVSVMVTPSDAAESVTINGLERTSLTASGDITINVEPKVGYVFKNWTVNGEVVSTENPYTVTITENREYVANLKTITEGLVFVDIYDIKDANIIDSQETSFALLPLYTYLLTGESVEPSSATYTIELRDGALATVSQSRVDEVTGEEIPAELSISHAGTIVVTATDQEFTATLQITAKLKIDQIEEGDKLVLKTSKREYVAGETDKIKTTLRSIYKVADDEYTWTSSAPEVIAVDAEGNITALSDGSATITASITDDFGYTATASINLSVRTPNANADLNAPEYADHYVIKLEEDYIGTYYIDTNEGCAELFTLNLSTELDGDGVYTAGTDFTGGIQYPTLDLFDIVGGTITISGSQWVFNLQVANEYVSGTISGTKGYLYLSEDDDIFTISAITSNVTMGVVTPCPSLVNNNAKVILTATPNEGYRFVNWTVNGEVVSTENPYTATITQNTEFVANFEEGELELEYCTISGNSTHYERYLPSFTLTDGVNDAVVPNIQTSTKQAIYHDKTSVIFETKAGATIRFKELPWVGGWMHGYVFIDYTKDGVFNNTLNSNGQTGGELVSYNFYSETGSSTGQNTKGETVQNNCNVTAANMPEWTIPSDLAYGDYRMRFKIDWNSLDPCGASDIAGNGGAVVDVTIRIASQAAARTITVSATEGGTAEASATEVVEGATVTLTATPNAGYVFENWTVNGEVVSTENPYTATITADTEFVANFRALPVYNVSVSVNDEAMGMVEASKRGELFKYTEVTLEAIPKEGYYFKYWLENGEVVSTDATYTITITEDRDVVACFEKRMIVLGKEYRIREVTTGKYLNADNYTSHTTGSYGGVNLVDDVIDDDQIFIFINSGANYKLKTKSGYNIVCQSWNVDALLSEGTELRITEVSYNNQPAFQINMASPDSYQADGAFKIEKINNTYYPFCDASNSNIATWVLEEVSSEYVDLGLPSGLKWATCNIGANSPEDYGDYFAWGEIETKDYFEWSSYKYSDAMGNTMTKYSSSDNRTTLDFKDDVARVNWGSCWRMPTQAEFEELKNTNNCTWEWTTQNGVNGYKVTSKINGNSIFIPATGSRVGDSLVGEGNDGAYWTSSLNASATSYATYFYFFSTSATPYMYISYRYNGYAVRAVYDERPTYNVSVSSTVGGKASVSATHAAEGSSVTLVASSNSGYRFTGWSSYPSEEVPIYYIQNYNTSKYLGYNTYNLTPLDAQTSDVTITPSIVKNDGRFTLHFTGAPSDFYGYDKSYLHCGTNGRFSGNADSTAINQQILIFEVINPSDSIITAKQVTDIASGGVYMFVASNNNTNYYALTDEMYEENTEEQRLEGVAVSIIDGTITYTPTSSSVLWKIVYKSSKDIISTVDCYTVTVTEDIKFVANFVPIFDDSEWEILKNIHSSLSQKGWTEPWNMSVGKENVFSLSGLSFDGSHVSGIDLKNAGLTGNFPVEILALPYLKHINLSANNLSGAVEEIVAYAQQYPQNMQSVTSIDISNNMLSGNVGAFVATFPNLTKLEAQNNSLSQVYPMISTNVTVLNLSAQTLDEVLDLDLANLDILQFVSSIPTILLYNHSAQKYDTQISVLCSTINDDCSIKLEYNNGSLQVMPTDKSVYYGVSGDELSVKLLRNDSEDGTSLKMRLYFSEGDATFSGGVDVLDLQASINFMFNDYNKPFNFTAANLWADAMINVQDVVKLVNILLDSEVVVATTMSAGLKQMSDVADADIYIKDGELIINSMVDVAAFDIVLNTSKGISILKSLEKRGFTCSTKRNGDTLHLIGYSLSGATLGEGETAICSVADAEIVGAMLSDSDAEAIELNIVDNGLTSIETVESENVWIVNGNTITYQFDDQIDNAVWYVYTIDGVLVNTGKEVNVESSINIELPLSSNTYIIRLVTNQNSEVIKKIRVNN